MSEGLQIGQTLLTWDDTPGSMNHSAARKHWRAQAEEKKRWEGIFYVMFVQGGLPKGLIWCRADVELRFKTARRRDPENFRSPISKPLADALVKGGYIPDDTDEFFEMGSLIISPQKIVVPKLSRVKSQMAVHITWHRSDTANHGAAGSLVPGRTSPGRVAAGGPPRSQRARG